MPDLKKMLTLEALSEALPSWLKRSTKPEYNADEIDSTLTTNQFVTASDKENWNAKGTYSKPSGGIPKSDLSSIVQTSLEKADSALQSETDPTVPSWAKQPSKPSYTQDEVPDGTTYKRVTQTEKNTWNGKQNALTTTQMQAVNSGITSEKVTQISTNQTNILYVSDQISKNQLDTSLDALKAINTAGTWNGNVCTYSVGSVTVNSDGTLTVKKTSTASRLLFYLTENSGGSTPTSGTKYAGCVLSGCPSGGSENTYSQHGEQAQSPWGAIAPEYGNGCTIVTSSLPVYFYIVLKEAYTTPSEGLTFKPMICTAEAWGISHEFKPYALPNYDLTYLEAEDRASLAEVVDSGAKNVWNFPDASYESRNSLTVTDNSDGSKTFTAENGNWQRAIYKVTVPTTGRYCLAFSVKNSSLPSSECYIFATPNNSSSNNRYASIQITGNGKYTTEFNVTGDLYIWVYLNYGAGTEQNSITLYDVMLCTKAAFGVSKAFVPYRPNYDLVGTIALQNYPKVIEPCDFNTLVDTGYYIVNQSGSTNLPWSHGEKIFLRVIRFDPGNAQNIIQIGWSFNNAAAEYCVRNRYLGTWGSWYIYHGTSFS